MKTIIQSFLLSAITAVLVYGLFDSFAEKSFRTVETYAVSDADSRSKSLATQLNSRLQAAKDAANGVSFFFETYDILTNNFDYRLGNVVADKRSDIRGLAFAYNAAYLKKAPYFWLTGDTLHSTDWTKDSYWEQTWYQEALKQPAAQWSEPYEKVGEMETAYIKPVKNRDGFLKGVLKAEVSLAELAADTPDEMNVFLINRPKNQIFALDNSTAEQKSSLTKALKKTEANPDTISYNEGRYHMAFSPVSTVGWTIAVMLDEDKVLSSLEHQATVNRVALVVGAVVFMLVLSGIVLIAGRKRDSDHRRIRNRMSF